MRRGAFGEKRFKYEMRINENIAICQACAEGGRSGQGGDVQAAIAEMQRHIVSVRKLKSSPKNLRFEAEADDVASSAP